MTLRAVWQWHDAAGIAIRDRLRRIWSEGSDPFEPITKVSAHRNPIVCADCQGLDRTLPLFERQRLCSARHASVALLSRQWSRTIATISQAIGLRSRMIWTAAPYWTPTSNGTGPGSQGATWADHPQARLAAPLPTFRTTQRWKAGHPGSLTALTFYPSWIEP